MVARALDALQLADALLRRAVWVERRLDDGLRLGVPQHEETITESVLLDLRLELPALEIEVFSRYEESHLNGADWQWWWEGSSRWFGGFVQAKRLKSDASDIWYYDLGYTPTPTASNPHPPQGRGTSHGSSRTSELRRGPGSALVLLRHV